jgi:hypothetical protein
VRLPAHHEPGDLVPGGNADLTHRGSRRILKPFNCLQKKDQAASMDEQPVKDPLHGVTLEQIVTRLVAFYGWDALGKCIDIRCFKSDPSVNSSLKFLRKTPWARKKVETLYLTMQRRVRQRNHRRTGTHEAPSGNDPRGCS